MVLRKNFVIHSVVPLKDIRDCRYWCIGEHDVDKPGYRKTPRFIEIICFSDLTSSPSPKWIIITIDDR